MKKKLLAILAAVVAVSPVAVVNAATDFDYSRGNEHNFIVNKQQEDAHAAGDETVGIKMISLGEDPEDSGYVLGLSTGAATFRGYGIYDARSAYSASNLPQKFEDSLAYQKMVEDFNGSIGNKLMEGDFEGMLKYDTSVTTPYVRNFNTDSKNIRVPKKDEVLSWFAYQKDSDTKYTLTSAGIENFKKFYAYSYPLVGVLDLTTNTMNGGHFSGYVLGDDPEVTSTDIYTWVMKVVYDWTDPENPQIAAVTVERISNNTSITNKEAWVMVPILSFNKTYNCKYDTTKKTACFKCGEDYQWLVVGEQASTCSIVSGVTSKAKCVKNPPTGVEDYILEFAIAAGICGIVLIAVKRKSLFSRV